MTSWKAIINHLMSSVQYATIPQCATPLQGENSHVKPKLAMSIPIPAVPGEPTSSPMSTQPSSPTRQTISNLLLSSTLHFPNPPPASHCDGVRLLSTREPLSLQVTTANFRRFVSRSRPIFWLQDRIEEVFMWRKGGKVTLTWMVIYAFLCYFPRMFLLIPHLILISILLANHPNGSPRTSYTSNSVTTANATAAQQPKEGTVDWYANLQAIQNLMGAVSDLYDAVLPFLPILTWNTPHTSQLLTVTCVSLLPLFPLVLSIPLRPTLLFVGLGPLFITHPFSLRILPALLRPLTRGLQWRAQRIIDNDNLAKRHWHANKCDIELWENERWSPTSGWSKCTLKAGERRAWTIDRGGWCDIVSDGDGDVRNVTFMLSPGYEFIETEDWRLDREGGWDLSDVDDYGWVYTNDLWQQPNSVPREEWKSQGMTRRRRWIRRIVTN
ncbi:integral peroxisomal membrane peroxin-domain-containing protein [Gautieria morchelliformis]|nr:integral peroxisomal membrane peroxin-domain-containing protein [Gautieria morchelliformis]